MSDSNVYIPTIFNPNPAYQARPRYYKVRVRRATLDQWQEVNPVLALGEMGLVLATPSNGGSVLAWKAGNGRDPWRQLPIVGSDLVAAAATNISVGQVVHLVEHAEDHVNGGVNAAWVFPSWENSSPVIGIAITDAMVGGEILVRPFGVAPMLIPNSMDLNQYKVGQKLTIYPTSGSSEDLESWQAGRLVPTTQNPDGPIVGIFSGTVRVEQRIVGQILVQIK